MKYRIASLSAVVALTLGCAGGSDQFPTVKVSGKVYLDDQLHTTGSLTLYPVDSGAASAADVAKPTVGGTIGSDGTYTLTTYKQGDGAPPGQYTVRLAGATADSGSVDPAAMMGVMSAPAVEELRITIPEGGSDSLDIRLKSATGGSGGGTLLGS